jgi:hypothetical protein
MARGRENARLARAQAAAVELRDRRELAGALVWDRDGRLTIVRVFHESGRRTVEATVEPRGEPPRTARGLRRPGLAQVVLKAMGFGAPDKRVRIAQAASQGATVTRQGPSATTILRKFADTW